MLEHSIVLSMVNEGLLKMCEMPFCMMEWSGCRSKVEVLIVFVELMTLLFGTLKKILPLFGALARFLGS